MAGKFTPELGVEIVKSIEAGIAPERAARREGVAWSTVQRWRSDGEQEPEGPYGSFAAALAKAEARVIGKVETNLFKAMEKGDTRSMMWWLSKRAPGEYGERVIIDESSAVVATPLSKDAADAVQAALAAVRRDKLRAANKDKPA